MAKVNGMLQDLQEHPEFKAGWEAYEARKSRPEKSIEDLRAWHRGWEAARDADRSP